jgi:hypothetical protein
MSFKSMFVLAVTVAAGMVQVEVSGQKQVLAAGALRVFGVDGEAKVKSFDGWQPPGSVLGFTGKGGQPLALERVVPGVQAALQLTEEEKRKIAAALDASHTDEVRAAIATLKLNPNATEAQKEEARKVADASQAKLRQVVEATLTQEQKLLVERIDTAVKEVQKEVWDTAQTEFGKGNPELEQAVRERVPAAVHERFKTLLTPEQLAAFEKAAAAQAAAEKEAKEKPKGKEKPPSAEKSRAQGRQRV